MEDTKDDLGTKVDELPNHAEEFNADCLSQTTGTNWSVGLTFDDPFAVQLATQLEVKQVQKVHQVNGEEPKGVQEENLQRGDDVLHGEEDGWRSLQERNLSPPCRGDQSCSQGKLTKSSREPKEGPETWKQGKQGRSCGETSISIWALSYSARSGKRDSVREQSQQVGQRAGATQV